jgi:hypothetical protein
LERGSVPCSFFIQSTVSQLKKPGLILGLVDRDQHVACKALGIFIEVRRVARRKASKQKANPGSDSGRTDQALVMKVGKSH